MKRDGFTLIEVALVMVIVGLLLAGASSLLLIYLKETQIRTTEQRIDAVNDAMQLFLSLNGRYPCPARADVLPDSAEFGVEVADCATNGAVSGTAEVTGVLNSFPVSIGAVPTRSLSLPDEYIADAWGGRFTLAVTERMTDAATFNRLEGAIDVVDSYGNPVVNPPPVGGVRNVDNGYAHYVIVSHGRNGEGAVPIGGGAATACPGGTLEEENCDRDDAMFVRTLLFSEGANSMDDIVSVRTASPHGWNVPAGAVVAFNLPSCPLGWVEHVEARGRTIVGMTGAAPYTLGERGGEEAVELELDVSNVGLQLETLSFPASGAITHDVAITDSTVDEEHENRPPYLALTYCEKSS
ncbi:MAG: prepilin-type N-terminal cleavage/methylation domain-containing protein [Alphaproteobacteria bacterium]|nr:prepilin-type N-terminal cleavage/methylation domain-containing protein [Alphaproteobacteria bacterium]